MLGGFILGMDGTVADALMGNDFPNRLFHLCHGPELVSSGLRDPYSKSQHFLCEFLLTFRDETLWLELASKVSTLDPVGSELYLESIDELSKLGNVLVKS